MKVALSELTQRIAAGERRLARQRAAVSMLQSAGSDQSVLAESVLVQLEISQARQAALRDCWIEIGFQSSLRSEAAACKENPRGEWDLPASEREIRVGSLPSVTSHHWFSRQAQFDLTDHMQAALLDLSSLKVMRGAPVSDDLAVLDDVHSSFTAMNLLIRDLRFAERPLRELPLSVAIHCAVHLVQDACKTIRPIAEAAGVKLDIASVGSDIAVRGDRDALMQAFQNLAVTAIAAAPSHTTIRISARTEIDRVRFSLAPEVLAPAYTAVPIAEEDLSASLSGWIARQIVEAHGGRLWMERSDPELSSIHFTIPSVHGFE